VPKIRCHPKILRMLSTLASTHAPRHGGRGSEGAAPPGVDLTRGTGVRPTTQRAARIDIIFGCPVWLRVLRLIIHFVFRRAGGPDGVSTPNGTGVQGFGQRQVLSRGVMSSCVYSGQQTVARCVRLRQPDLGTFCVTGRSTPELPRLMCDRRDVVLSRRS